MGEGRIVQSIRVKKISTRGELQRAFAIRLRVFVAEQRVPREIELDKDDERATHFLAILANRPVGTARLVIKGKSAKIGRMAVLKQFRNRGIGRLLLKRVLVYARKCEAGLVFLNAQVPVIGFYEKLGFQCVGKRFMEAGIPHRRMVLSEHAARKH